MGLTAAWAMVKKGFCGVTGGNADFLSLLGIGDAAIIEFLAYRLAYLLAIATDKPLTIDRTLVLWVLPAVNKKCHQFTPYSVSSSLGLPDPQIPL